MIDVSTLSLDDLRRLYPIVSLYNAESVFATGAKTMGDLWRIQSEMFARLKGEDPHFVERDRFEIQKDLEAARQSAQNRCAVHGHELTARHLLDGTCGGHRVNSNGRRQLVEFSGNLCGHPGAFLLPPGFALDLLNPHQLFE